jgi:MOSC domain-containing protein YiiM
MPPHLTSTLASIQIGKPKLHGRPDATNPLEKPWESGFFKDPISGPVRLDWLNIDGDGQADLENHGGRDKAVCVYSAEHYPAWRSELQLPNMPHGAFGENFTLANLTDSQVCIGDVFEFTGSGTNGASSNVRVQVSQPRQPCWKLGRRWLMKELPALVIDSNRTGWYFRVLMPGNISPGMTLQLIERPHPDWPITRANDVLYRMQHDAEAMQALASLELLSQSWRDALEVRINRLHTSQTR